MRWDPNANSNDVEDRRGQSNGGGGGGGMSGGGLFGLFFFLARTPLGIVGALVVVGGIVAFGFLRNVLFSGARVSQHEPGPATEQQGQAPVAPGAAPQGPPRDRERAFVSFVLDDVQHNWQRIFEQRGTRYPHAKLVLYNDATRTGCGYGEAATGPFYCPTDSKVYLDLGFFHDLANRLGAKGEFAEAYVIAHELGHHVQNLLGDNARAEKRGERQGATSGSVRLELQADCYAGVWAKSTSQRDLLEAGDIEQALTAAAAVGDDRLQKQARGTVRPESFTHGSSAQRQRWFKRGFDGGMTNCDTFGADAL